MWQIVFCLLLFSNISYAARVVYQVNYPPGTTTTMGSVPSSSDSSFYYSSGGNSIGYSQTIHVPVIMQQYNYPVSYPNFDGYWVWMRNGGIPPNALVMQYINGFPIYHCRVQFDEQIFYGTLAQGENCYVNQLDRSFGLYQVLLR